MRTPLIAGNWKLYKTITDAVTMIEDLKPRCGDVETVEIVVAPVFTSISAVAAAVRGSLIKVAGQDCFWQEEGAFTGEVSPSLLKDAGCSHVIVGHSERRQFFGETDETVNKKVKAALKAGLTVLVCVGETLAERESNSTTRVVRSQVSGGLQGIDAHTLEKVVIAYEPVWAIGTGKTATNLQAQEVHADIRQLLAEQYGQAVADTVRILYGGSVKPDNIKGLMEQADIDGALVGGASLNAESFAQIISGAC